MGLPDNFDELEAELDPTARLLVKILRAELQELKEQNARLTEQLAKFQRMLFGKRSEKLPPIENEVRRVVEKDELTVEGKPMPKEPKAHDRERRRKARKKSEPKRKQKRALRKNLPVVKERIEVAPEQLPEGTTFEDFRELGKGEIIHRVEHVREHPEEVRAGSLHAPQVLPLHGGRVLPEHQLDRA